MTHYPNTPTPAQRAAQFRHKLTQAAQAAALALATTAALIALLTI